MKLTVLFVLSLLFALNEGSSYMDPLRVSKTFYLTWTENMSDIHPPSNPLRIFLGDTIQIACPPNITSNIWIQNYRAQYNECRCNATGVPSTTNCSPATNVRQVCYTDVILGVTANSAHLNNGITYKSGEKYYLISYSQGGGAKYAGFGTNNAGGECLLGYKMVFEVVARSSIQVTTTTEAVEVETTTTSSTVQTQSTTVTTLPPPGIVNENLPVLGGLVNGAIATITTRVYATLLVSSVILALSCV